MIPQDQQTERPLGEWTQAGEGRFRITSIRTIDMANPYLDQLELAIADLEDVLEDGKLTVGEVFQLAPRLIARVQAIMAEAETFTEADQENILLAADTLYDKYIVPLDIPWVPENVETSMVDPVLKAGIRLALTRAMRRFIKNGLVGSAR